MPQGQQANRLGQSGVAPGRPTVTSAGPTPCCKGFWELQCFWKNSCPAKPWGLYCYSTKWRNGLWGTEPVPHGRAQACFQAMGAASICN